MLGEIDMFDDAVRLVLRDSRFDSDIVVSVFETNIRILGSVSLPCDWYILHKAVSCVCYVTCCRVFH